MITAFVIVLGVAAFFMAVAMPAYAGLTDPVERVWRSAWAFGLFGAYPAAITLGFPAYLMLRRHFDPTLINCSFAGAVVAALPWAILGLMGTPDQADVGGRPTVINGSKTAFGWLMDAQFLGQVALFGMLGGALFWVIAAAGSGAGKVLDEKSNPRF